MFGSLGVPELAFIFVLALLVFGPKRLPELGRTLGKAMAEFRKATTELKRTINAELIEQELRDSDPRRAVRDTLREAKDSIQASFEPPKSPPAPAPAALPAAATFPLAAAPAAPAVDLGKRDGARTDDAPSPDAPSADAGEPSAAPAGAVPRGRARFAEPDEPADPAGDEPLPATAPSS